MRNGLMAVATIRRAWTWLSRPELGQRAARQLLPLLPSRHPPRLARSRSPWGPFRSFHSTFAAVVCAVEPLRLIHLCFSLSPRAKAASSATHPSLSSRYLGTQMRPLSPSSTFSCCSQAPSMVPQLRPSTSVQCTQACTSPEPEITYRSRRPCRP